MLQWRRVNTIQVTSWIFYVTMRKYFWNFFPDETKIQFCQKWCTYFFSFPDCGWSSGTTVPVTNIALILGTLFFLCMYYLFTGLATFLWYSRSCWLKCISPYPLIVFLKLWKENDIQNCCPTPLPHLKWPSKE